MSVPRLPHAADEPTFDAEKPDIVRPMIGASLDVMAALVIRAINQDAANAGGAQFSEGDFLVVINNSEYACRTNRRSIT